MNMLQFILKNKKPTIWGSLATFAYILKENPDLLAFLDPDLSKQIMGWVTLVCTFLMGRYIVYKGTETKSNETN